MASTLKLSFAAFSVLAMMASQAMSRNLNETSVIEKHEQWMAQYGRIYQDEVEKANRYKIFKENVEFIKSFNKAGTNSYKLGINQFADLTNEEFRAARNGYKARESQGTLFSYEYVSAVPPTMDWRKMGAVTGIKDQGQCGCCWAFSAVAAMEGIHQLKTGQLISLSEQELVDCDTENRGCGGGNMGNAFTFIIDNKGLTTEANYPYQAIEGTCNADYEASQAAEITGYVDVPANNEAALLKAVANQPVSVAIDPSAIRFYTSGVFTGECGTELTHAAAVVGYGTSSDGTKYWLVKNSWGNNWGENGYIRMQRDIDAEEGLCGIAMKASYPTA